MASKCKKFLINSILPTSILFISLFQLYFHYSTILTPRSKEFYQKDGQNDNYNFQIKDKQFDLNLEKLSQNFDDNPLMNINILKNMTMNFFKKLDEKRENKLDLRIYELFYLFIHDAFYLIFIYVFYFGVFKSGIFVILCKLLRFYFKAKRIRQSNPNLFPFQFFINYYYNNMVFRNESLFTPEGFELLEYFCNYFIILDFLWLYILIKRKKKYVKYIKKDIMTDDNKVENKNKNVIEEKGPSGESKATNNINESNNNNNENDIQTGTINIDEGYEEGEESDHISEDPINQQETN